MSFYRCCVRANFLFGVMVLSGLIALFAETARAQESGSVQWANPSTRNWLQPTKKESGGVQWANPSTRNWLQPTSKKSGGDVFTKSSTENWEQQARDLVIKVPAAAGAAVAAIGTGIAVTHITRNPVAGAVAAIATFVLTARGIANASGNRDTRATALNSLPTSFSGKGSSSKGSVSYTGTRSGSRISGSYSGGRFGGTVNSARRVRGGWRDSDGSAGRFSGTANNDLSRAFGSSTCIKNCD